MLFDGGTFWPADEVGLELIITGELEVFGFSYGLSQEHAEQNSNKMLSPSKYRTWEEICFICKILIYFMMLAYWTKAKK